MIVIYRDYQVIDGFVQEPPNLPKDKNTLSEVDGLANYTGSFIIEVGFGRPTVKNRILRFPISQQ